MSACVAAGCSVSTGLQRCKQCKASLYCSKVCQRIDWVAGHHLECKPIAADPDDDDGKPARKLEGDKPPKKRQMRQEGLMQRLRLTLMTLKAQLVNLVDNPPQSRPEDFMYLLQLAQEDAERAASLGHLMQMPVSGTLVPLSGYLPLLKSTVEHVTELYTRVNDPDEAAALTQKKLDELVDRVNTLVSRVRSMLLNPEVWLERNRQGSAFQLTSLPEDIVTVVAQKQRALEIDVNRVPVATAAWAMSPQSVPIAIPASVRDEMHGPVVSEGTVYRFFVYQVLISDSTGQHLVGYPALQAAPLSASSSFSSAVFLPGLHGSLWEVTQSRAANFRWSGGQWHMIQRVDLPALGWSGRAVGVDKDNRMWMVQSAPPMVGMLRTDQARRTPTFVSWALPAHYERLYQPTVTASGLVAIMLGAGQENADKTGLVRFEVDSQNNHTTEELRASSKAVQLANSDDLTAGDDPEIGERELSDVMMTGDRVSTQISVLDDQNQLLHVHDLVTRSTETYKYTLNPSFGRQLSAFTIGNDGRSYLVVFNDLHMDADSTVNLGDRSYRLSA